MSRSPQCPVINPLVGCGRVVVIQTCSWHCLLVARGCPQCHALQSISTASTRFSTTRFCWEGGGEFTSLCLCLLVSGGSRIFTLTRLAATGTGCSGRNAASAPANSGLPCEGWSCRLHCCQASWEQLPRAPNCFCSPVSVLPCPASPAHSDMPICTCLRAWVSQTCFFVEQGILCSLVTSYPTCNIQERNRMVFLTHADADVTLPISFFWTLIGSFPSTIYWKNKQTVFFPLNGLVCVFLARFLFMSWPFSNWILFNCWVQSVHYISWILVIPWLCDFQKLFCCL